MKAFNDNLDIVEFQNISRGSRPCDTFVFTRFNLKLWKENKYGVDTRTKEWTESRFDLFEKYCFPSMKSQTNKDFMWICMFADDTEPTFVERIRGGVKQMSQFFPVFLNEHDTENYVDTIDALIRKFKGPSKDLLTLRLDNDDALNSTFIDKMLSISACQKTKDCIYSFKRGLQYYTGSNLAYGINYPDNHYLFIKTNNYDSNHISHVFKFRHDDVRSLKYPFNLVNNKEYMWVEVIHEQNVANDVKLTFNQRPITDRNLMKKEFCWDVELSNHAALSYFSFLLPRIAHMIFLKIRKRILGKSHY